jgi:ABC-type transport system substrate-binding protein
MRIEHIAPPIAQQIDGQDDPHEHPSGEKRKAINYAVEADLIRRTILGGHADLFGQMLHPWNYSGYNPNKEWYDYNPEKAKELLKEAGYENGFEMERIATNGCYPGDKAICEVLLI